MYVYVVHEFNIILNTSVTVCGPVVVLSRLLSLLSLPSDSHSKSEPIFLKASSASADDGDSSNVRSFSKYVRTYVRT